MPTLQTSQTSALAKRISVKHLIDKSKKLNAFVPWFSAILGTILFFAILGFILEQMGCLKSKIKARPKRRGSSSRSTIKKSDESMTVGEQVLYEVRKQSAQRDNVLRPSQRRQSNRTYDTPPAEGRFIAAKQKNGANKRQERRFTPQKEKTYSDRRSRDKSESRHYRYEEESRQDRHNNQKQSRSNNRKKEKVYKTYSRDNDGSSYESYSEKYNRPGRQGNDAKLYGRYKKHDGSVGRNRDDRYGQNDDRHYRAVGHHKENRLYGRCKQGRQEKNFKDTTSKRLERTYGKREMKQNKRTELRPSISDAFSPDRRPTANGRTTGKQKGGKKVSSTQGNMSIGRRKISNGSLSIGSRSLSRSELRNGKECFSNQQEEIPSIHSEAVRIENEK